MTNKKVWVDFDEIKKRVSLEQILAHYNCSLSEFKAKEGGKSLYGVCPIHGGYTKAFKVTLSRNIWKCFGCDRGGDIFDLVVEMEEIDLENKNMARREAGIKIIQWFGLERASIEKGKRKVVKNKVKEEEKGKSLTSVDSESRGEVKIALPFGKPLKSIEPNHDYLLKRGLNSETIAHFGLGYFYGRGMMSGRVVIPIHNEMNVLVAYAGRLVKEDNDKPKYLFPPNFKKGSVVYNLNRAKEFIKKTKRVILVEGFFSVFALYQAGIFNVVSLMGCEMTKEQEDLIVDVCQGKSGCVSLMLDNDTSGLAARREIASRLIRKTHIMYVDMKEEGCQPDHLSKDELRALLLE
jgi:DNA primase